MADKRGPRSEETGRTRASSIFNRQQREVKGQPLVNKSRQQLGLIYNAAIPRRRLWKKKKNQGCAPISCSLRRAAGSACRDAAVGVRTQSWAPSGLLAY